MMCYGGKKKGGICSLKAYKKRLCCGVDMQHGHEGENVFDHRRYKKQRPNSLGNTQSHTKA